MTPIISGSRKIVLACDFGIEKFPDFLLSTRNLEEVGAYKIPAWSGKEGWKTWIELNRIYRTGKPLIYDHQALGTDVSHIAGPFLNEIKQTGFDAIILKPKKRKPKTLKAYISAAKNAGLGIMIVGRMTDEISYSEEGIKDSLEIYEVSLREGVTDFGVPGNQPEFLEQLKKLAFKENRSAIALYPIGIGGNYQGGNLEEISQILSEFNIHPIIGREIYNSENHSQKIKELSRKL